MAASALAPVVTRNRLNGSTIERYVRNGLPIELPGQDIRRIIDLTRSGFGTAMDEEDIRQHILPVDFLYVASWKGDLVGFASSQMKDGKFYFSGVVVDKTHQNAGIATDFARARVEDALRLGYHGFWTRTQNPVVEYTLSRALDQLREDGSFGDWTMERRLLPALYGKMLTASKPISRDSTLNETYSALDHPRGDAFRLDISLAPC